MPELPEAEIARRQLERWATGVPVQFELLDPAVVRTPLSSRPSDVVDDPDSIIAALGTPESTLRHGKRIGWSFGERALLVHLGMSGKFVKRPLDVEPPKFARLGMRTPEHVVWFLDLRRFGCVTPVAGDALGDAIREGHGPDALDEAPDGPALKGLLTGRRAIKVALMDQAKLAGIGNIQAVEALFRAGIDPRTPCAKVSDTQWDTLSHAIPAQLQYVIDAEDAGEITYVTEDPTANPFAVYKREGEPCPRCSGTIETIRQSGRSTFFCPDCQH